MYTYYGHELTYQDGQYDIGEIVPTSIDDARDKTSDKYIEPISLYTSKVIRNKNDAVICIQFVKQKR